LCSTDAGDSARLTAHSESSAGVDARSNESPSPWNQPETCAGSEEHVTHEEELVSRLWEHVYRLSTELIAFARLNEQEGLKEQTTQRLATTSASSRMAVIVSAVTVVKTSSSIPSASHLAMNSRMAFGEVGALLDNASSSRARS
jgi:hypothetical protein